MDWYQFIIGLTAILGVVCFFISRFDGELKNINESIKGISARMDAQGRRMDAQGQRIDAQGERIDAQGQRTDRLYQMFVDLLKEGKK